jgi:predicted nucleotidyltransferase/HEPN domain-containing protein
MVTQLPNTERKQALQAARRFVRAVQKTGIHLDAAFLYGSYVLGTAHADSDIDVALVSNDFTHRSDDWVKLRPVFQVMDARIEHVRYRPKDFRDASPLVWEIKTTGISLLGKPSGQFRVDPKRPLKTRAVVNYWRSAAERHWQTAKTMFRFRRYLYALSFGTLYIEAVLKRVIVYRTRTHAPFRLPLKQLAERANLTLTPAQRDLLARLDTYTIEADAPDHPLSSRKFTRRFCQAEMKEMRRFGKRLAALLDRRVSKKRTRSQK